MLVVFNSMKRAGNRGRLAGERSHILIARGSARKAQRRGPRAATTPATRYSYAVASTLPADFAGFDPVPITP
jgi:hypothetical protein